LTTVDISLKSSQLSYAKKYLDSCDNYLKYN